VLCGERWSNLMATTRGADYEGRPPAVLLIEAFSASPE
jgi:hypothetical protein